jgi:hypothetical protein
MAMVSFRASPLPNPKPEYDREYMLQLIRVIELYFNKLDSNAPLFNQSYRGDFFYGGEFIGDQFTGGAFDGTTFTGDHFVGGDFTGTFIGSGLAVTLPYGSFYDTTNQAGGSVTTEYPMRLAATDISSGVSVGSRSAAFTGSIALTVLTVASGLTGLIFPGMLIAGTTVAANTYVVVQLTGTSGGVGTYTVSVSQTVTSRALTGAMATKLTVTNAGIYNLQFSAQFINTDTATHDIDIWFRKNAATPTAAGIANSNSVFTIHSSHGGVNGQLIAGLNYMIQLAAADFLEIMWHGTDLGISIATIAAGSTPTTPQSPGVIATLQFVSAIP